MEGLLPTKFESNNIFNSMATSARADSPESDIRPWQR